MADILESSIRVSVIIPAYNAAKTLEKAVFSVLSQTERSLEVILVDDCSSDETKQVAERLALTDTRIRVVSLPQNRGKPYALNLASAQARGKWIAVLDADDWYAPERLEQLIDAAETHDVQMAADNLWNFDAKANAIVGTAFPVQGEYSLLDLDGFLRASDPMANFDYGMLKPIFLAEFIRAHNITDYEPARIGEDFYVLLCFFAAGGKAYLYHAPFYYYTQPFGSISRQWAQEGRRRYNFKLMKEIHEHFMEEFRPRFTDKQMHMLAVRGQRIQAMEHFHRMRECILHYDITGVLHYAFSAPYCLWPQLAKRLLARLRRTLS